MSEVSHEARTGGLPAETKEWIRKSLKGLGDREVWGAV